MYQRVHASAEQCLAQIPSPQFFSGVYLEGLISLAANVIRMQQKAVIVSCVQVEKKKATNNYINCLRIKN